MPTEEQPYDVVEERPDFELRWYPEHVVAETRVKGSFEGVGNRSFMRLVGYIGGRNTQSEKVAMTAPVLQEAEDEKVGLYVVSFVMPAGFDLRRAPEPTDPNVRLRSIPAHTAAALRFSGRWSRGRYEKHARRLLAALEAAGLEVDGPLRFARFDPPWTPWFRRRNEVVAPVLPAAA
jgi:effector-binding domain-containing protein